MLNSYKITVPVAAAVYSAAPASSHLNTPPSGAPVITVSHGTFYDGLVSPLVRAGKPPVRLCGCNLSAPTPQCEKAKECVSGSTGGNLWFFLNRNGIASRV